jgi:hypothetical protein
LGGGGGGGGGVTRPAVTGVVGEFMAAKYAFMCVGKLSRKSRSLFTGEPIGEG